MVLNTPMSFPSAGPAPWRLCLWPETRTLVPHCHTDLPRVLWPQHAPPRLDSHCLLHPLLPIFLLSRHVCCSWAPKGGAGSILACFPSLSTAKRSSRAAGVYKSLRLSCRHTQEVFHASNLLTPATLLPPPQLGSARMF